MSLIQERKTNKEVLELYDWLRNSDLLNVEKEREILNSFNVPLNRFKWKYAAMTKLGRYIKKIKDHKRRICDRVRKELGGLSGKSHYRLPPPNYMEPRYDADRDMVICDVCNIEY